MVLIYLIYVGVDNDAEDDFHYGETILLLGMKWWYWKWWYTADFDDGHYDAADIYVVYDGSDDGAAGHGDIGDADDITAVGIKVCMRHSSVLIFLTKSFLHIF